MSRDQNGQTETAQTETARPKSRVPIATLLGRFNAPSDSVGHCAPLPPHRYIPVWL